MGGVTGYICTVLRLALFAFAFLLAPPSFATGLGLRRAAIDVAHDNSSVVTMRWAAGRSGFSRVLLSQSAGLVIVFPNHFSTLASCRRSHGMGKAPVVAGCLELGLSAHVKMKNRLHRKRKQFAFQTTAMAVTVAVPATDSLHQNFNTAHSGRCL